MGFVISRKSPSLPDAGNALTDRKAVMNINPFHYVNGNPIVEPVPAGIEKAVFGLGCFWGAERKFWQIPGVFSTAAGYAGGITVNPTYHDVCSGMTGHTEAVLVFFDPRTVSYEALLKTFWESHDPTQGMRQGNDLGTQYRSAVYFANAEQEKLSRMSLRKYQQALGASGTKAPITTEIAPLQKFYYAEDYHQQYLAKNPGGYCGLGGTGVCYVPE